jgi:hypothetical protein
MGRSYRSHHKVQHHGMAILPNKPLLPPYANAHLAIASPRRPIRSACVVHEARALQPDFPLLPASSIRPMARILWRHGHRTILHWRRHCERHIVWAKGRARSGFLPRRVVEGGLQCPVWHCADTEHHVRFSGPCDRSLSLRASASGNLQAGAAEETKDWCIGHICDG